MATLDAEIVVPPVPIEALVVAKPAEVSNEIPLEAPACVTVDARQGVVRRSRR